MFEMYDVSIIPEETYFKADGQLQLKWTMRNVAGVDFTQEPGTQIVNLKVYDYCLDQLI